MPSPRYRLIRTIFFLISAIGLLPIASAQVNTAYVAYVRQYQGMAIDQMYKYGVPASITLAQGLLESRAGQSMLAVRANNHFGIKVSRSWRGPYVLLDDDAPNEKFRSYRSPAESYEDHSRFLCTNARYASLFRLERTDYKGWSRGLKAAGYATNPRYAELLISLIERYELHQYDKFKRKRAGEFVPNDDVTQPANVGTERQVLRCNGTYYVVARAGDTYADIAHWAGISERKLRRYNEVPRTSGLAAGDVVYLMKKARRADRSLRGTLYQVKNGDSMHSIAQRYGMRLETLYKINGLKPTDGINVGDRLVIR